MLCLRLALVTLKCQQNLEEALVRVQTQLKVQSLQKKLQVCNEELQQTVTALQKTQAALEASEAELRALLKM